MKNKFKALFGLGIISVLSLGGVLLSFLTSKVESANAESTSIEYVFTSKDWESDTGNWNGNAAANKYSAGVVIGANNQCTITSPVSYSNITNISWVGKTNAEVTSKATIFIDDLEVGSDVLSAGKSEQAYSHDVNGNGSVRIVFANTLKTGLSKWFYVKSVSISYDTLSDNETCLKWNVEPPSSVGINEEFTASVNTLNFDESVMIEWSYSTDKENWISIGGNENSLTYSFSEKGNYYLRVYAMDDINEFELISKNYIKVTSGDEPIFTKVKSVDDLVFGKEYLIATADAKKVMSTQNANNRTTVSGVYDSASESIEYLDTMSKVVLLPAKNNKYLFYDIIKEGLLCSVSDSNNYLHSNGKISDNNFLSISIDNSGVATMTFDKYSRNKIKANSNSNLISCYSTGQTDLCLFMSSQPAHAYGEIFGEKFLENTDICCDPTGVTPFSENDWKDTKELSFDKVSECEKAYALYAPNSIIGEKLGLALERYDYIVNKYTSLNDYLGRRPLAMSSQRMIASKTNQTTNVIIVATCIFLASSLLGAYLHFKRVKKN